MKIITTPMCEDALKIAGVKEYSVVKPTDINDADIAVLLSETKTDIPTIAIKLNTYSQLYESIRILEDKFNTSANIDEIEKITELINTNINKQSSRNNTKVKVYSNFLKDIVSDMGYIISNVDYDFIVLPDYMNIELEDNDNVIIIPSHKNVSKNIIQRIKERYELLENKLCMKQ
ncbi:hypothetical protein [Methanosphaera sp. WGK6]|uniref:hypothetical protein n=1 Tax=Methanosphaera sp. WGK6 TaxID=1561964 RepID=UPI00084C6F8F|nr:hypothetical protein [Methanosphaera sp. WGK6]OED30244.1 hypothetical protein NL43_03680 [Methanosphaera sp. WGK6]